MQFKCRQILALKNVIKGKKGGIKVIFISSQFVPVLNLFSSGVSYPQSSIKRDVGVCYFSPSLYSSKPVSESYGDAAEIPKVTKAIFQQMDITSFVHRDKPKY